MHSRLTRLLPLAIGILALLGFYGQLLRPDRALAERDIPGLHLPMLKGLADAVADGVPSWNPVSSLGGRESAWSARRESSSPN